VNRPASFLALLFIIFMIDLQIVRHGNVLVQGKDGLSE